MINRIHHVNFLVRDLTNCTTYMTSLLGIEPELSCLPERYVKTATYKLGECYLVLVSPTSELGEPARILKEKGPGLFLISFSTPNIDTTLSALKNFGINTASPRRQGLENWIVQDLTSPDDLGAIIQLCETTI
ncbi:glyoxalase [Alteromonas sediminis]|uniref:Glyoxalase n=1 Tax=Alteromonas sediminis TaxID=2259342 RepID=A0A3N5XZ94_9ALTE|nr:VOC family protein [Alteromonas sediminis]RPJ65386.1 glyoxalase [Alteromonas sediminis]